MISFKQVLLQFSLICFLELNGESDETAVTGHPTCSWRILDYPTIGNGAWRGMLNWLKLGVSLVRSSPSKYRRAGRTRQSVSPGRRALRGDFAGCVPRGCPASSALPGHVAVSLGWGPLPVALSAPGPPVDQGLCRRGCVHGKIDLFFGLLSIY